MSSSVIWIGRAFAFAWNFLLCLGAALHAHDTAGALALTAGYAVIGGAIAVWALLERRGAVAGAAAVASGRAWVLGVVCAVAGTLSATHEGTLSVVPAAIAALVAGQDCVLGVAASVTGAGVLCALATAVAVGNAETALLVGLPATIVGGLLIGRQLGVSRVQAAQAVELLERTRELQVQQRRADVLDERTRIAREIHDVLAHSLGSLSIQIQAARAVLADGGDVATVLEVLADAQRLATGGLAETRRALHALRAGSFSLEDELRTLAGGHTRLHEAAVEVEVEGDGPGGLDPAAAMTLLRVAQEALVNAAKHAPGRPVRMRLEDGEDEGHVRLTARNAMGAAEGRAAGSLSTADSGFGLAGMRERLLLAGGSLEAGVRAGEWVVEAVLPLAGRHDPAATKDVTEGART